jgi:O-antigen/teichoic acid export membrane protein
MKHTIQTFFSHFGVLFINVFSSIILSRGLTPDDRGIYLGITMWSGFIYGLCDIGIYTAAVYFWGKSKESEKRDVFATLFIWALLTGILCVAIVVLLADWMIKAHLGPKETLAAYVFFFSTLFGPITTMVNGVLAAEQRFSWINLTNVGLPAVTTAFWVVYFLGDTLSIAMCLITSAILPLISLLILAWQVRERFRHPGKFRLEIFRQAAWYGLRGYGGSLINTMGNNSTQLLVFSLTPAALAYFQTAGSAAGVLWSVPRAIAITSFPYLVQTRKEELHVQLCRILRLTALATALGMIALGAVVPVLVPLLFGSPYTAAVLPALILMPNALFGGLSDVLAGALNSTGRTFHTTVANACYVGVTLLTLIVTLPNWGLTGAAVSTLFGHLASLAVRLAWYTRTVRRIALRDLIPSLAEIKEWMQTGLGVVREAARKLRRKPSVLER